MEKMDNNVEDDKSKIGTDCYDVEWGYIITPSLQKYLPPLSYSNADHDYVVKA